MACAVPQHVSPFFSIRAKRCPGLLGVAENGCEGCSLLRQFGQLSERAFDDCSCLTVLGSIDLQRGHDAIDARLFVVSQSQSCDIHSRFQPTRTPA
jgi:hypothetical protein